MNAIFQCLAEEASSSALVLTLMHPSTSQKSPFISRIALLFSRSAFLLPGIALYFSKMPYCFPELPFSMSKITNILHNLKTYTEYDFECILFKF